MHVTITTRSYIRSSRNGATTTLWSRIEVCCFITFDQDPEVKAIKTNKPCWQCTSRSAGERRGVGGIFFDDLEEPTAEDAFRFLQVTSHSMETTTLEDPLWKLQIEGLEHKKPSDSLPHPRYCSLVRMPSSRLTFLSWRRTRINSTLPRSANGSCYAEEGMEATTSRWHLYRIYFTYFTDTWSLTVSFCIV